MRILVADDDRVVVHLVAALLRDQGHVVVPVFDAMTLFATLARVAPGA
jgi:DNA-binding response OmpR family regulator